VHSLGGRFLELDSSAEALADIVADGVWYQVDEKKALEKAKQTLRQIPVPTASKLPDNGPLSKADDMPANTVLSPIPTTIFPVLPPTMATSAMVDPRLIPLQAASLNNPYAYALLANQAHLAYITASLPMQSLFPGVMNNLAQPPAQQQQQQQPQPPIQQQQQQQLQNSIPKKSPQVLPYAAQECVGTSIADGRLSDCGASNGAGSGAANDEGVSEQDAKRPATAGGTVDRATASASLKENASNVEDDEEISEFLLSVLQLSSLPRFTEDETEKERASMSDEERAAMLSDMYGKCCDVETHTNKKARQDLDEESIAFLVRYTRAELERFPKKKKQALMEAQEKCREEEFVTSGWSCSCDARRWTYNLQRSALSTTGRPDESYLDQKSL
jgi:hypothetical protein